MQGFVEGLAFVRWEIDIGDGVNWMATPVGNPNPNECDELPVITSKPTGSISSGHSSGASSEPCSLLDFKNDDSAYLSISSSDSDSSDGSIPILII